MKVLAAVEVDDALLHAWPLPTPQADGDKEDRGRVVVVAGSREMPGAAVLAATAAMRAGAGKLVIATPQSAAQSVAACVPEARVIALPEASDGGPSFHGLPLLQALGASTSALLIGPGMIGRESTLTFVQGLLPVFKQATVLLDAIAMDAVMTARRLAQPVILTPHAGEMAHLTGGEKDDLREEPLHAASRHAERWQVVLALKGATTIVARPDGEAWLHACHTPGLGMSGSGDVLAGVIAGLAARGASPEQAAVWGVALHARAGDVLAARYGTLGYLARELPAEIPALMHALA
ncbi:NAD(P)H-hydrate dehydratase [Ramlibacter sp. PS3R-8]|uniref:NAD(P)H-hydrate dehydratase n=1 Tax=Ramlibacter sp. PS3R-8 TaxID=3133437 RepID=UPI0030A1E7DF